MVQTISGLCSTGIDMIDQSINGLVQDIKQNIQQFIPSASKETLENLHAANISTIKKRSRLLNTIFQAQIPTTLTQFKAKVLRAFSPTPSTVSAVEETKKKGKTDGQKLMPILSPIAKKFINNIEEKYSHKWPKNHSFSPRGFSYMVYRRLNGANYEYNIWKEVISQEFGRGSLTLFNDAVNEAEK